MVSSALYELQILDATSGPADIEQRQQFLIDHHGLPKIARIDKLTAEPRFFCKIQISIFESFEAPIENKTALWLPEQSTEQ